VSLKSDAKVDWEILIFEQDICVIRTCDLLKNKVFSTQSSADLQSDVDSKFNIRMQQSTFCSPDSDRSLLVAQGLLATICVEVTQTKNSRLFFLSSIFQARATYVFAGVWDLRL
jgi:hypothetical protein